MAINSIGLNSPSWTNCSDATARWFGNNRCLSCLWGGYISSAGPGAGKNTCKVDSNCHHVSERKLERSTDGLNLNEAPIACFKTS